MIWISLLSLFLVTANVSARCVQVPNEDMVEYNCEGGSPSDLLSIPENTEKIRITRMSVSKITADMFSRFGSNLWVLSCSHCNVEDIDDNAFRALENLQQLSLDNNRLKNVRAVWFKNLEYLTYLDLNHNQIEDIELGVFENLPHLVDLRLSGNRLQCLNIGEMKHLKQLKRVFLTENPNFKCPGAVTRYLETQNIMVEKDPSWASITQDLVPYFDKSYSTSTEPAYRQRLHLGYETSTDYPDTTTYRQYYNTRPYQYSSSEIPTTTESDMIRMPGPDWRTDYSSETPDYDRSEEEKRNWNTENRTPQAPPSVPIEMIHPASPDDFYQGPYYAPKVTSPQINDNYRQSAEPTTQHNDRVSETKTTSSSSITTFNNNVIALGFLLVALQNMRL